MTYRGKIGQLISSERGDTGHVVCQWQLRKKKLCKQMAIKETKHTFETVMVVKGSQIIN
jgi:predicted small secreted protein